MDRKVDAGQIAQRAAPKFSLRTLMIVFVAIAVVLGIVGSMLDRQRRLAAAESQAGDALTAAGVVVSWRANRGPTAWSRPYFLAMVDTGEFDASVRLDPASDRGRLLFDDDDARWLADCPQLQTVRLACTRLTDEGARHLGGLQQLATLDLSRTRISDVTIDLLVALPALEAVGIEQTRVTPAGRARLMRARPGLRLLP